ncbi:hypothetical protein ACGFX8_30710 [Streptomyces sp. NPDC048362]|uniref:hypothetical protein n=1 Tax=Streptomyces sp. NPDC048362 TaxID=3365539 RepID=UPI003719AA3D
MTVQTTSRADILQRSRRGSRAVKNPTAHLADTSAPVTAVRELVDQLPDLDDVREVADDDRSPLDETEAQQRAITEDVIHAAIAAGDAAIWVIGQALTVAAKGKFHRDKNQTFDEYAREVTGKSPAHARRWMDGAPLALAVAAAITTTTPPEGHVRPLRKIEKAIGTRPTIELYRTADQAAEETGRKITGAVIEQIHKALPSALPEDPEEAVAVVRDTARRVVAEPPQPVSRIGEKTAEEREESETTPGPVRISASVPAAVAATLDEWAGHLSLGHRVPLTASDVLTLAAELAVANGSLSLQLLSNRIEVQHGEHVARGVSRFTWSAGPRSKAVKVAERRVKGHAAAKGHEWAPRCATPAEGNAQPCDDLVIWKVEDPKRGTSYCCDKHLPAEDAPPGLWRN